MKQKLRPIQQPSAQSGLEAETRRLQYLASSLFLDHDSDLIILVVNTLTQDLRSDNYLTGDSGPPLLLPSTMMTDLASLRLRVYLRQCTSPVLEQGKIALVA